MGGVIDHWKDALVSEQLLGLPPDWRGNSGSKSGANWRVYLTPSYQCDTVHHSEVDLLPCCGVGEADNISGEHALVGTGDNTVS